MGLDFVPEEPGPQTSFSQEASGSQYLRTDPKPATLPHLRVRTGYVAKRAPGPQGQVNSRSCCSLEGKQLYHRSLCWKRPTLLHKDIRARAGAASQRSVALRSPFWKRLSCMPRSHEGPSGLEELSQKLHLTLQKAEPCGSVRVQLALHLCSGHKIPRRKPLASPCRKRKYKGWEVGRAWTAAEVNGGDQDHVACET